MREHYRILLLAFVVAASVVPVGYSLSLESDLGRTSPNAPPAVVASTVVAPTHVVAGPAPVGSRQSDDTSPRPVQEVARLVVLGAAFFGLAMVVRRAV